jgi:hypothetical protein
LDAKAQAATWALWPSLSTAPRPDFDNLLVLVISKQLDATYGDAKRSALARDPGAGLHEVAVFCQSATSGILATDPGCLVDFYFYLPSEKSLLRLGTNILRDTGDPVALLNGRLRVAKQEVSVGGEHKDLTYVTLPWALDPGWALRVPDVWIMGAPWPGDAYISISATPGTPFIWDYTARESAVGGNAKHTTWVISRLEPEGSLKGFATFAILQNQKP